MAGEQERQGDEYLTERILTMARGIAGVSEGENPLLETLCRAAEAVWTARLRDGVSAESCAEAFCCAVAFTAAADYAVGQEADGVSGFSAGEVSVQLRGGNGRTAAADALRQTAERLMAPYAEPEDFCFKGVRA